MHRLLIYAAFDIVYVVQVDEQFFAVFVLEELDYRYLSIAIVKLFYESECYLRRNHSRSRCPVEADNICSLVEIYAYDCSLSEETVIDTGSFR